MIAEAEHNPWDRRSDETALAYDRFTRYRLMSPVARSTDTLARADGVARNSIQKMAQRYDWMRRVAAWDQRCAEKALEGREHEYTQILADQFMVAQGLGAEIAYLGRALFPGVDEDGDPLRGPAPEEFESRRDALLAMASYAREQRDVLKVAATGGQQTIRLVVADETDEATTAGDARLAELRRTLDAKISAGASILDRRGSPGGQDGGGITGSSPD